MAANTTNKNLQVPDSGTLSGAWAAPVNSDWQYIDTAFGGYKEISATGLTTQTMTSGVSDTYSYIPLILRIKNAINNDVVFVIPSGVGGQWAVRNDTTDGTGGPWTVTFASGGAGTSVILQRGVSTLIYSDGTNIKYSDNWTRTTAGGSTTQVQYNSTGALTGSAGFVYDSSTGYVGIGNTSPAPTTPSHPLTVKGIIRTTYSSGTTGGGIQFPDGTVQTSAATGGPSSYVASIDFGSTGLLPSIPSVGAVTVGGTLAIAYGGTGATSAGSARTALGAASSGANSDITSLTGLTTALSAAQGGTGQSSYTDGQLLIGNTATGFLSKATITAGSNITVTNGNGTITIAASGTGVTTFSGGSTGLTPSSATGGAVTLAGTLIAANGGTGLTSPGTAGNVLTSTGSAWASSAPTVAAPSAIGQVPFSTNGTSYTATQKIVQTTSQASTSGTSIDFTGIPSWVKRITVMFNGVSTNGSSQVIIQLGTSGGAVTSGYLGGATVFTSGILTQNLSSGFSFYFYTGDSSSAVRNGSFTISNLSGNDWTGTGGMALSNSASSGFTTGIVPLGAALTLVRITTVSGSDTFDAGTINIMYE